MYETIVYERAVELMIASFGDPILPGGGVWVQRNNGAQWQAGLVCLTHRGLYLGDDSVLGTGSTPIEAVCNAIQNHLSTPQPTPTKEGSSNNVENHG